MIYFDKQKKQYNIINIILYAWILLGTKDSLSQNNSFTISNRNDMKLDLTSLDDTLGYLTIEQDNWKYYVFGNLIVNDNKLFFDEKYYNMDIKKEISYEKRSFANDSIEIHFEFYHLLLSDELTYLNLSCSVSSNDELPIKNKLDKNNSLRIKRPEGDFIKVTPYAGTSKLLDLDDHEIEVKKDFNYINVNITMLLSTYDYSKKLKKIVPRKFTFKGKKYFLKTTFL